MSRIRSSAILVLLSLPLLIVSLGNCTQLSAEEKKAAHYERGMDYFEAGKYSEALIEFRNIIQLDPKDAKAYHQMALIHLKLGGMPDLQAAFWELTKAVEFDPSIEDAHLQLGEFYLHDKKPQEAKKHAEIVLASSPQDPKGHLLRGRSLIIEKEFEEGIAELQKSLELDPTNEQVYIDLARAFFTLKKFDEAFAILGTGLQKIPNSTAMILAQGDLLALQGKTREAETYYQQAITLDPDDEALYPRVAKFFEATRQFKKAEEVYQQMAARKPKSEQPQILLGNFYVFMGTGEKALAHYRKARELNPQSNEVRKILINFYLDNQQWDQAEQELSLPFDAKKKDAFDQTFAARLLIGRGKTDQAIPLLQRILKAEPDQAMAHQHLGMAWGQKNDIPQAIQSLSQAKRLAPQDRGIRKAMAIVRLAEGSYDLAIEEARAALQLNPRDLQAVHILAQAFLGNKDVGQAKRLYEAIVDKVPQDFTAHYKLGLIARQDKKYQEALDHFEQTLKINKNFIQAITQMASLHVDRGEAKQARERVQQQIAVTPDNPLLYNLLGRLWMRANQADQAEQAFKKALELDGQIQASYMNLAELYERTNRVDDAVREYNRLLEKNPKVASAHMILGMIAEQKNQLDTAKDHYRKTLAIDPDFAPAANNLAWLLVDQDGNLDEALGFAENARAQQPEDPHTADTLGWIYYKRQAYLKAVSLLQEAAQKLPEHPVVQYHLGMAQYKKGEEQQARKTLERALMISANFPGADDAKATLDELKTPK